MDKIKAGWLVSFIYIIYIYIAKIPYFSGFSIFSTVFVSLLLIVTFIISGILLIGFKNTGLFLFLSLLIGSFFELLSMHTGIPFGLYYYTNELGLEVLGLPIFIPFLWASIAFYSYKAGGTILMPILMVAMDLSFDPRYSGHLWIWEVSTQYFGDPISNFIGWLLVSTVIIVVYSIMIQKKETPNRLGVIYYFLFGVDNCISDFNAGLNIPALISAVIFLFIFVTLLLYKYYSQHSRLSTKSGKFSY
ncbi:MAG: carotenoid biosynthesis protein [Thermoplasmataceae archaeon]